MHAPKSVLVVGGHSQIGEATLRHLTGRGFRVVCTSRQPQPRDDGVEETYLDVTQTSSWLQALRGHDAVFLIVPERDLSAAQQALPFAQTAAELGVTRGVLLSARGVDQTPMHPLADLDTQLGSIFDDWVVLRPNWFMQNFTTGVFSGRLTREDAFWAPGGKSRISFIDVDDIGAVAAQVLTTDREHLLRRSFELSGPEALTFGQVADIISDAKGIRVTYHELTLDDPELAVKLGLPSQYQVNAQALFGRVLSGGEEPVTTDVEEVLGRPATAFDRFADRMWAPVSAR